MSSRIRAESCRGNRSLRAGSLLVGLALVAIGCAATDTPEERIAEASDPVIDARAVIEAHGTLVAAYEKGDTNVFLLMLDESDDVMLFHPRLQDRWVGLDEIRQNLPVMFERIGKTSWLDVHLSVTVEADAAWLTSQILIESPELEAPFTGRGTEIWVRRGNDWRLSHAHWSENPEF